MKFATKLIHYIAATGLVCIQATHASPADDVVKGKVELTLISVHAVLQNGSPAPQYDAACKKQTSEPNSKYLGIKVTTDYSINPKTLMMGAESMLPSPQRVQPLELTIALSPLGLSNTYSFGAFRPAELPNTYVLFSISHDFKTSKSSILVLNSQKTLYNCAVSSEGNSMQLHS